MKSAYPFLAALTAYASAAEPFPQYSTETKPRAQYSETMAYRDDGSAVRGKVTSQTPYDGGFADGCLAGVGGPQTKRLPSDKEYSRGWKAGKRECKANYDRLLRGRS